MDAQGTRFILLVRDYSMWEGGLQMIATISDHIRERLLGLHKPSVAQDHKRAGG